MYIAVGLVLLAILGWGIHYSVTAPRKNRDLDEEELDRKSSITQHAQGNPVQQARDPKLQEKLRRDRERERQRDNEI